MKKFRINWKKIGLIGLTLSTITAIGLTPVYISSLKHLNAEKRLEDLTDIANKEDQQEFFEDVNMSDVENYIYENNVIENIKIQNSKVSRVYSQNNEIDIEQELQINIQGILNGEILISDIENNFIENIKGHEEYKNQYEALKAAELETQSFEETTNNYVSTSEFDYNPESTNFVSYNLANEEASISGRELKQLQELINYKENLNWYLAANSTFTMVSVGMTAVAWGVAAFYWGSWWMLGGNIPFALAATLQALTMTVSTGFALKMIADIQKEIWHLNEVIPNHLHHDINNTINTIMERKSLDSQISYGDFVWSVVSFLTIDKMIDIMVKKWSSKIIITRLLPTIAKNVAAQKAERIILLSTSWANPIVKAISLVDTILSAASMTLEFVFYMDLIS